ncbi:MAG: GNAT family N-acetyltransferase [Ignavibacteriales bacterium]|nr:GNAT family N-acetyltransferase [Ignavibacteriales bacterium]
MLQYTTQNLLLRATTKEHLLAELEQPQKLAELLNVTVTEEWPPGEYDKDAVRFLLSAMEEADEKEKGWFSWYGIESQKVSGLPCLVAAGGFFGPPSELGIVEIGYSVIQSKQGRGYATEIVQALVNIAFSDDRVNSIIAHTYPVNVASVKVLEKNGFYLVETDDKTGLLLFELVKTVTIR